MASEEEAMAYSRGAVERAMKVQEVILRAIDGKLTWVQAADILGYSPRTIRRIRWRLQHYGYDGLLDRRRQIPSPKRAPVAEVQRLLALYRERYLGFNVRHFHQLARRQHGVRFCYAFVKQALQTAGLVAKHQPRGRHRRRREPRPCFGELLHLDGSRHQWLALVPELWLTMIVIVDDATKQVLYAELRDGGESVAAIMIALRVVLERHGLPMALYTGRAHWAAHTPTAGGAVDRRHPTQVGRALARLGIEHILGYSPEARGRSERANRTLQGRLVNEFRLAGITTSPRPIAISATASSPASTPNSPGRRPIPPPRSCPSPAPISIRSSASRRSASSDATMSSRRPACRSRSPSNRVAAPVPACASSYAAISTASIPSGMAHAAWGDTTAPGTLCAPREPPAVNRAAISRCQTVAVRSRISNRGSPVVCWGYVHSDWDPVSSRRRCWRRFPSPRKPSRP